LTLIKSIFQQPRKKHIELVGLIHVHETVNMLHAAIDVFVPVFHNVATDWLTYKIPSGYLFTLIGWHTSRVQYRTGNMCFLLWLCCY